MKKNIAFGVIGVLGVAIVVLAIFLVNFADKLNKEIDAVNTANTQITTLNSTVSTLQGNVSSLQSQLTKAQNDYNTVQTNFLAAQAANTKLTSDLSAAQNSNTSLTAQLKAVYYPRNFSTVAELTDWLQKDDTNIKYASITDLQRALTLEVRATESGYILPARIPLGGTGEEIYNVAVIGAQAFSVRSRDDVVQPWLSITPVPTYPIPAP